VGAAQDMRKDAVCYRVGTRRAVRIRDSKAPEARIRASGACMGMKRSGNLLPPAKKRRYVEF